MAHLRFRLSALSTLRKAERDRAATALAEARHAEQVAAEEAIAVSQSLLEAQRELALAGIRGILPAWRLAEARSHEEMLAAKHGAMAAKHAIASAQVEQCRAQLAEHDARLRALEKLQNRQLGRQRRHDERADAQRLDELACQRYAAQPSSDPC